MIKCDTSKTSTIEWKMFEKTYKAENFCHCRDHDLPARKKNTRHEKMGAIWKKDRKFGSAFDEHSNCWNRRGEKGEDGNQQLSIKRQLVSGAMIFTELFSRRRCKDNEELSLENKASVRTKFNHEILRLFLRFSFSPSLLALATCRAEVCFFYFFRLEKLHAIKRTRRECRIKRLIRLRSKRKLVLSHIFFISYALCTSAVCQLRRYRNGFLWAVDEHRRTEAMENGQTVLR